jgi:hypothetical protein
MRLRSMDYSEPDPVGDQIRKWRIMITELCMPDAAS